MPGIVKRAARIASTNAGAVNRVSVLKVLLDGHGTVYQRTGGAITISDIETEIAAISNPNNRARAELDFLEPNWSPSHSLVTTLATELSLDSDDIDAIFAAAVEHEQAKGT